MLPAQLRFVLQNATDGNVDANLITLLWRGLYFVDGELTFTSVSTDILGQSSAFNAAAFLATSAINIVGSTPPPLAIQYKVFLDLSGNTDTTLTGQFKLFVQAAIEDSSPVFNDSNRPTNVIDSVSYSANNPDSVMSNVLTQL